MELLIALLKILVARVKEITDNCLMDCCIEATGLPCHFLKLHENVCFGGKIILIGNTKKETTFNHSQLVKKELNVYGPRNHFKRF